MSANCWIMHYNITIEA